MNSLNLHTKIKDFEFKQRIISFILLLIFCGSSIILNNLHLTSLAQESTKYLSRFIAIGDQREVTLVLQQAHLSNYKTIQYKSKVAGNSFVIPAKSFLDDQDKIISGLVYDKIETPVISSVSTLNGDSIIYEFNRFRLVPYAIILWMLVVLISVPQTRFLKRKLTEQFIKDLDVEKHASKAEIATQVRHNLRTPLAALLRISQKLPNTASNEKDLLQITIRQVQALIGKLDIENKIELSQNLDLEIYDTLNAARQEISAIIPASVDFAFNISDLVSSSLVKHVPFELRSIMANMVNNSLEAIEGRGRILITVSDKLGEVEIKISDTGHGIPKDIVNKIFDKDFTFNKVKGSGIGLFHAKSYIQKWKGSINVESIEGVGTTFVIHFPIKDKAQWYLPRIKINLDSKIYVLDDQPSALELWKQKMTEHKVVEQASLYSFSDELLKLKDFGTDPIFLIDYDLGSHLNGLNILSQLPHQSTKCLVTGHFDDRHIRDQCVALGVYLIPKSQIEDLNILKF